MANIASRNKQVRKDAGKRLSNKRNRSALKSALQNFNVAFEEGDKDRAYESLKHSLRLIDRSVTQGIHTKNYANRKKSSLQKAYNSVNV